VTKAMNAGNEDV